MGRPCNRRKLVGVAAQHQSAAMMGNPGFGALLASLLDLGELSEQTLADPAGVTADEVRAVLAGESPGEVLLRCPAPALRGPPTTRGSAA